MNFSLPKPDHLSLTMAELLQNHSAIAVFRALVAQRVALRQSRPPPHRLVDLPHWLLRDIGGHEPRDLI